MEIGERIAKRRKELGLSQQELANMVGYSSRATINKIELGVNQLKQSKLKPMAKALQVSPGWILGDEDDFVKLTPKTIPILGSISCGQPVWAEEVHGEYVETENTKADFGLYATGDSMINARIHDGDLVLCRKQDAVNDGEIAVVAVGDETTLKRFYYYPDDDLVILRAENPAYRDQIYRGPNIDQIRVIGKAVGVQFRL